MVTLDLCPSLSRCNPSLLEAESDAKAGGKSSFENGSGNGHGQGSEPSVLHSRIRKAPDMFKLKRFKSNLKAKKHDSMQEAALRALESCLYRLRYNAVLVQITRRILIQPKTDIQGEIERHAAIPPAPASASLDQHFPPLSAAVQASKDAGSTLGLRRRTGLVGSENQEEEWMDVRHALDPVVYIQRITRATFDMHVLSCLHCMWL